MDSINSCFLQLHTHTYTYTDNAVDWIYRFQIHKANKDLNLCQFIDMYIFYILWNGANSITLNLRFSDIMALNLMWLGNKTTVNRVLSHIVLCVCVIFFFSRPFAKCWIWNNSFVGCFKAALCSADRKNTSFWYIIEFYCNDIQHK